MKIVRLILPLELSFKKCFDGLQQIKRGSQHTHICLKYYEI